MIHKLSVNLVVVKSLFYTDQLTIPIESKKRLQVKLMPPVSKFFTCPHTHDRHWMWIHQHKIMTPFLLRCIFIYIFYAKYSGMWRAIQSKLHYFIPKPIVLLTQLFSPHWNLLLGYPFVFVFNNRCDERNR